MKNWKKALIGPDASIRQALEIINSGALRLALVVDEHNSLMGLVTDGDVRRALLGNFDLSSVVSDIMNPRPVTAPEGTDRRTLRDLMESKSILSIPLVDQAGTVVAVESLENTFKAPQKDNPVFIMAGGFGKRLRPLTDHLPKPMLQVGEKPMLETLLDAFIKAGFTRFYISTHYLPEVIRDYFGNGASRGVQIEYVHEETPLGTGGALGLLPADIPRQPIIMINGDILTTVDFDALLTQHKKHQADITMCVREYDYQIPYGVVKTEEGYVISLEEKPVQSFFVNAGVYVVSPDVLDAVSKSEKLDMPDLIEKRISEGHSIATYLVHEYWLDIGRMEDFKRAQHDIKNLFQ